MVVPYLHGTNLFISELTRRHSWRSLYPTSTLEPISSSTHWQPKLCLRQRIWTTPWILLWMTSKA